MLLTVCEKGLDEGIADVAPAGQVMNSVLQVRTRSGGIYRFFNYSEDYTHTYTSFNGGCSLQAYLGRWTLGAYADNGWNFMEGEHRRHRCPSWPR